MADNKTRVDLVQILLDETINALLERIRQKACDKCGARAASAQDINNVLKFLKENGFTVDPTKDGDALDKLLQGMNKKTAPIFPELPS